MVYDYDIIATGLFHSFICSGKHETCSQNHPARVESVHLAHVTQIGQVMSRLDHVVNGDGGDRAEDTVPDETLNCRLGGDNAFASE